MDISKASNFERFIYEVVERDPQRAVKLWQELETAGSFDLSRDRAFDRVRDAGFLSGSSTHADRIATIRAVHDQYGVIIDPHTADGVKVGLEHREQGVPLICLETAQPAKFAETILQALGREPERPYGYEAIESLPQRYEPMDADPEQVKRYIAAHCE